MIRRLDDANEGVTTPRWKPPCKAIKGKQAIIDKPRVPSVGVSGIEGGAREKGRGIKRGETKNAPGSQKQQARSK